MAKPREYFKFNFSKVVKFDCTCGRRYINTDKCLQETDSRMPQTNADKIRAMNDEELAEFLEEIKNGEVLELCADFKDGCWYSCKLHHACDEETSKLYLQWLQSEAE